MQFTDIYCRNSSTSDYTAVCMLQVFRRLGISALPVRAVLDTVPGTAADTGKAVLVVDRVALVDHNQPLLFVSVLQQAILSDQLCLK